MTKLTIVTILLLVIIQIKANRLLQQVACTEEAKECPDGSFVVRTGPNCEFTECPPCQVTQCLIPPCQCITCPEVDACLKDGICDTEAKVVCKKPICIAPETLITPNGECCPTCQLDCRKVLCLTPKCKAGYELFVPEGQCCPMCKSICPDAKTMEFVQCVGCPSTCDNPNPICLTVCRAGCRCKAETPIWSDIDGKCISAVECVPDCSTVTCEKPVCQANEVEVIPNGACCAICEVSGDKVECNNISDCEYGYKCKPDPKCGHLIGFEKLVCLRESSTKKVCRRRQKHTFCPMDDCDKGYECVRINRKRTRGICVDYQ